MNYSKVSVKKTCRLCLHNDLKKVVDFPLTYGGEQLKNNIYDIEPELIPIDLYQCTSCSHVQVIHVPPPSVLFGEKYSFMTRDNPELVSHFKSVVEYFIKNHTSNINFAFEIGSNDGVFLELLRDFTGCSILGIDPSQEPVNIARKYNINTVLDYFELSKVDNLVNKYGQPDMVVANNVFAHMDDIRGVLKGIQLILKKDGYFLFEVSYLKDVVDKYLIGTIIHEHLSIHSVYSLIPFLNEFGLNLVDARHIDNIQGGSIVGIAKKIDDVQLSESVEKIVKNEKKSGILTIDGMREFNTKLHQKMELFKGKINSVILNNRVIGFGASRSAPLIIDILGLKDKIEYVIDNSPQKIGKYLPIGNIPIININDHDKFKENYVYVILGWAQTKRIVSKIKLIGNPCYIVTIFPNYEIIEIK